jgi:hypothetical protein
MLAFYLACLGAFLYQLYVYFLTGRVEVATTRHKLDYVEAPSFAICPFWPATEIKVPGGFAPRELLHVVKYGVHGPERLEVQAYTCIYDRTCICGDLWEAGTDEGSRVIFHDHLSRKTGNIGAMGEASKSRLKFRERIEVKTRARDGSGNETLKIGFYDSIDERPKWFYMHQGAYVLGTLELSTWTVSHCTFGAMYEMLKGDWDAMSEKRHLFRYTSQEVATHLTREESIFSYKMKDFFIVNNMSAETSLSFYSLAYLLFIFAIRHAVVNIFIAFMFPVHDPHKGEAKHRDMSHHADLFAGLCCCFWWLDFRRSERSDPTPAAPGETSRLLPP